MTVKLNPRESQSFPHYKCRKTAEFEKAFRKLDMSVQKMLGKTVEEVLSTQPYESKRLVSAELRGRRSLRKGDYRIIFAVCEECRKLQESYLNNCKTCNKHETNAVMLFTCGHRKHIYDA